MSNIITALWVFVVGNLVLGVFLNQSLSGEVDEFFYFTESSAIPLVLLSAATWIHLVTLYLVSLVMKNVPAERLFFPRLWDNAAELEALKYQWEKISAALVLALPNILFIYFWIRFFRQSAWVKQSVTDSELVEKLSVCSCFGKFDGFALAPPGVKVGLWDIAHPCIFYRGWDIHRYGASLNESVSYLPFWQPLLIMALPTILIFLWTVSLAKSMKGRGTARYIAVHPV